MSVTRYDSAPESCVSFRTRFLAYFVVWFLAILALEVFLEPEGHAQTDLTVIQQRLRWPLQAPVAALIGLAHAFSWAGGVSGLLAFVCIATLGIAALAYGRRASFVVLISLNALMLFIAIIYYIRWSRLPSGG